MITEIKRLLKKLFHAIAPKQYASVVAIRDNRHGQYMMAKHGVSEIAKAITERYGSQVLAGPFKGMLYIAKSAGSSSVPKLLGIYECELDETFKKIMVSNYDTVADVGSAEGFYAVGLALRMVGTPNIYAFDINPEARRLCHSLAAMNGVERRVVIRGECNAVELQKTLIGKSLVICDCEGYEAELLQPKAAPALLLADVLVELHDWLYPGITPIVLERFVATHDILLIDTKDRNPADYPEIGFLEPEQQRTAISEFRPGPQQWAFMTPKS